MSTNPLKRNLAVLAAATVVGGLGIGGLATASADNGGSDQSQVHEQSDGDGETADDAEGTEGTEETDDGPDVGPDADPNEPGHQDADESGEGAEQSDGDGEMDDAAEAAAEAAQG